MPETGGKEVIKMEIAITRKAELEKALDEVQRRCRARVTSAEKIIEATKRIKDKSRLTYDELSKMEIVVNCAAVGYMPHSYHGIPESTHFTLRVINKKWYVTDIFRSDCQRGDVLTIKTLETLTRHRWNEELQDYEEYEVEDFVLNVILTKLMNAAVCFYDDQLSI